MTTLIKRQVIVPCCLACAVLGFVCTVLAAETKSSDEQTLRDLDAKWSAAAAAKDVDKTVSYYADDATVLPANAPIVNSKDGIRKLWQDLLTSPGAAISWKTTKVEVARSGDMGCTVGTYELSVTDPSGKPINDRGKYVAVWQKKGGTWKCGVDIWNSDLSAAGSAPSATP